MKTIKISVRLSINEIDALDEVKITNGFKTTTEVIKNALKEYFQKLKKKKGNKETIEIQFSKTTVEQLNEIIENTDYQDKEDFIVAVVKEKISEFQKVLPK